MNEVEKVKPHTFKPPHHKLKQHIEAKLEALLKEYDSQFTQMKPPLEPHL